MSDRPSRAELLAASDRLVDDIIAPGLSVLFCGINPGQYSAAVGHHFARPGNRFWKALHGAGLTPRLLAPAQERELLEFGIGITNLVARASAMANELSLEELRRGAALLSERVERFAPARVAILGVGAYRSAFRRPKARIGRQEERVGGAVTYVLPNPSGAQARYHQDELAALFSQLRTD